MRTAPRLCVGGPCDGQVKTWPIAAGIRVVSVPHYPAGRLVAALYAAIRLNGDVRRWQYIGDET